MTRPIRQLFHIRHFVFAFILIAASGCSGILGGFSPGSQGADAGEDSSYDGGLEAGSGDAAADSFSARDAAVDAIPRQDAQADAGDGTTGAADAEADASDATAGAVDAHADASDATTGAVDAHADASDATTGAADAEADATDATTGVGDAQVDASDAATGAADARADAPDASSHDTLAFTSTPTAGAPGVALASIQVAALAAPGTIDTTFAGTVTLALAATPAPGTATLGGTITVAAASGVATFTGVTISAAGTYALVASTPTMASVTTAGTIAITSPSAPWRPVNGTVTGGYLTAVAVDPTSADIAYAGAQGGGVYKTTNGTQANAVWSYVGLPGQSISAIAVDPTNSSIVYAAGQGLFRSLDGGATWSLISGAFGNPYVSSIALVKQSPTAVWIATSSGLYESGDGGKTWTHVAVVPDAGTASVSRVTVAPEAPSYVYAAVSNGTVYGSSNGGGSFAPLPAMYPADAGATPNVMTLTVDPTNPLAVWAGVSSPSATIAAAYTSVDGGSWQAPTGMPLWAQADSIVINPSGQTSWVCAYGSGVYTSTNAGASWTEVAGSIISNLPLYLAVAPTNSSIAYVAKYAIDANNMYLVETGGSSPTWSVIANGIHAFNANSVSIVASSPNVLYLGGGYNGVHRSADGAQTWTAVAMPIGGDFHVAASDTNPYLVYSGSNGVGIAVNLDAGSSVNGVREEPNFNVNGLAVAPTNDQVVYAAVYTGGDAGVYITTNGGTTWTPGPVASEYGYGVAVDPNDAGVAYVGLSTGTAKTTNYGASWTPLTGIGSFTQMAIDPTNTQNLFATNGSIFKSVNGGASWITLSGAPPGVVSIAVDPLTPSTVYAGATGLGLWRSLDSGATWAALGLAGWTPLSIAINPATPMTVYVGLEGGGLWETTTGGE